MKLLKEYLKLEQKIHIYFNYMPQWESFPLSNGLEMYWCVSQSACFYSDEPMLLETILEVGPHYKDSLYGRKNVFRGQDYTMICVDTQTDGNKFLMIFDNEKECKDPEIIEALERW